MKAYRQERFVVRVEPKMGSMVMASLVARCHTHRRLDADSSVNYAFDVALMGSHIARTPGGRSISTTGTPLNKLAGDVRDVLLSKGAA